MKKNIFILLCIGWCTLCNATSLTLDNLQQIFIKGDFGRANQFLATKNWYFYNKDDVKNSHDRESQIIWSEDNPNHLDYANAWLTAYIDNYGKGKMTLLSYQLFELSEFGEALAQMDSLGYVYVDNKTILCHDGEDQESVYRNEKYVLVVTTSTKKMEYEDQEWVDGYTKFGKYHSGHYKTVTKTIERTTWTIDLSLIGGNYDSYNGHKYGYSDDGVVNKEYTLKNGIYIGEYKTFFSTGKPHIVLKQQKGQWLIKEYDRAGRVIGDIVMTIPKETELIRGKVYELKGHGFYKRPMFYLNMIFNKNEGVDTDQFYDYEIEGDFIVSFNINDGLYIWTDNDESAQFCKYTKYDYEKEPYVHLQKKTVTTMSNGTANYCVYDTKDHLIEQGQTKNDVKNGEVKKWIYSDAGDVVEETIGNYQNGLLNGTKITTKYYDDGIKVITTTNYKMNELDGYYCSESYINDKRQLDSYCTYTNGVANGPFMFSYNDTVFIGNFKDGKFHGRFRVYKDGEILFRIPQHVITDTTKLTLVSEYRSENGKTVGIYRNFYPCYYSDTVKMIRGEHVGELYKERNIDNGVTKYYSHFSTKYIDSTYTKFYLEIHYNIATNRQDGYMTLRDETGKLKYQKHYKDDMLDGKSEFFNCDFSKDGHYQATFSKGIWQKSEYINNIGNRIVLSKISSIQVCEQTFSIDNHIQSRYYYYVDQSLISGFNNEDWIDIHDANDTYLTGEYYLYDNSGRVIEYREKDANFIVHNDYEQNVTYYVHNSIAVPIKYYKLKSRDFFSGVYIIKGKTTTSYVKIKNGYRDGVTKIVDNKTERVISKVKYSKGIEK